MSVDLTDARQKIQEAFGSVRHIQIHECHRSPRYPAPCVVLEIEPGHVAEVYDPLPADGGLVRKTQRGRLCEIPFITIASERCTSVEDARTQLTDRLLALSDPKAILFILGDVREVEGEFSVVWADVGMVRFRITDPELIQQNGGEEYVRPN